jgi:hypothetical protein
VLVITLASILLVLGIGAPWARRKLESIKCGNYIVSIGCAARLWASEHDGHMPSSFAPMSDYLGTTTILICPGDHSRRAPTNWAELTPEASSYEIVDPSPREGDTNGVFLRCKIHNHLGYADATVFDGVKRRTKFP